MLLILLSLTGGCAVFSGPTTPASSAALETAGPPEPPTDPRARLQYHVLVAELAAQRNAPQVAAEHYLQAASLSRDPELAASATRYALIAEDEEGALMAAMRWSSLAPDAVPPRELIARNHLRQGRNDALYAECTAVIARHPEGRDEGFREVALLLGGEPAHADAALAVMQRLVNDDVQRAAAHYAYGLLAVRLDRAELGIQQAEAALKLERDWPEAYLLKIGAQIRASKFADAEKTLALGLARTNDPVTLRLAYARLLLEAGQNAAATAQYREVLRKDKANPDALYALALIALQEKNLDEAHRHLLALFEVGERRDSAAWFLAQIEEERGKYREADNWYRAVTGGDRALDAAIRRGFTLYKLEGLAAGRAYLGGLRNRLGGQGEVRLYAAEAELYFENKQPAQALARYEAGLHEFPGDADLLYGRAMMRAETGEVQAAEADFRAILARQPEDARSLNALGYLLANYSDRYQEAASLIERALKITPEDPAIMDSMGWVQYRLGNLDGALQYLQEAFKREPDPEIAAHLGEVLWQLGRRDKAQDVWKTALAESPDHRVLRETVDRLSK